MSAPLPREVVNYESSLEVGAPVRCEFCGGHLRHAWNCRTLKRYPYGLLKKEWTK